MVAEKCAIQSTINKIYFSFIRQGTKSRESIICSLKISSCDKTISILYSNSYTF